MPGLQLYIVFLLVVDTIAYKNKIIILNQIIYFYHFYLIIEYCSVSELQPMVPQ